MDNQQTEVLPINSLAPDPSIIERAAQLLCSGKLVVFPTETVYGLGADAFQIAAVEQIFAAKGRPFSDPLIVHIATLETLETLVREIPPHALQLAQAFWPGPLTLLLPAHARVPKMITAGLDTVAVRMPRHPVALALIQATGSPIAAPSANRFMHVSPTIAQHALADLDGRVPLILDGGPCEVGIESTILDLCAETPRILRPGGVSLEALRTILPQVQPPSVRSSQQAHETQAQQAPGQMLVHYAPRMPAFLFEGNIEVLHKAILAEIQKRQAVGERVGILLVDEDLLALQNSGAFVYSLGSIDALEQVAARLFAGLRTLEEAGVQVILCRSFGIQGAGMAIRDRLLKAAGGKVIYV
ncbi:MAG: threonylcarbamoyl-AMP synthase [Ktedonobacteraceae bacterium]|nr:threonylcarbamoyl-AMP synthase [Ktedonobacteraceae bacterium]